MRVFVNLAFLRRNRRKRTVKVHIRNRLGNNPSTEGDAQIVVNHFKNYLAEANRLYKLEIETARNQQIEERDRELREAVARLEQDKKTRESILRNIRF